jgi:hypothetical protein
MKLCRSAVITVLLVACGGSEPAPKPAELTGPAVPPAPAASSLSSGKATSTPATPDTIAACTMTKALNRSTCAPCVQSHCCSPPVPFDIPTAQALGCRMGCRKPPFAGMPQLGDSDREAVTTLCLAKCNEMFEASEEAIRLDRCIAERCNSDCLSGP